MLYAKSFMLSEHPNSTDSIEILLDGISTAGYQLRLESFKQYPQGKLVKPFSSQAIHIPAGEIHAVFKKGINKGSKSLKLTYIPGTVGKPTGFIVFKTRYF